MNQRKVEAREIRLALAKARVEARERLLKDKGLDKNQIARDSTMRALRAEVRKVTRSLDSLRWEPPQPERVEKPERTEKPAKGSMPAKEAGQAKAPKPPKEKKAKPQEAQTEA